MVGVMAVWMLLILTVYHCYSTFHPYLFAYWLQVTNFTPY